ncbi:hypothetical protein BZA77DRAFT_324806 [Pyronema omphalodes]|nr:hypothetical protein BZA77DRAFT_324806 [Pyronema omphalodes]
MVLCYLVLSFFVFEYFYFLADLWILCGMKILKVVKDGSWGYALSYYVGCCCCCCCCYFVVCLISFVIT